MSEISKTGYWDHATASVHHENCFSQELSIWICDFLKGQEGTPVYDFGCGMGHYLHQLQLHGFYNLMGFEGEPPQGKVFHNIVAQDLSLPFSVQFKGNIISLEVGEHIPAEYMGQYLANIASACSGYLFLSWSIPGQPGFGHVNCLTNEEIISVVEQLGFEYLVQPSSAARSVINSGAPWFQNTLMVFKKTGKISTAHQPLKVTIYTIAWNEEMLLPQFYDWYKTRFPKAEFILIDNESDDNTANIAASLGMQVISDSTDGTFKDSRLIELKNSCWKNKEGWVIVCDVDEWLDIDEASLLLEEQRGTTAIPSIVYNMCNTENTTVYKDIRHGINMGPGKTLCFKLPDITEINYEPGAHQCFPAGNVKYAESPYTLRHVKYLNEQWMVNRFASINARMSDENKNKGWSYHYLWSETKVREEFLNNLSEAKLLAF